MYDETLTLCENGAFAYQHDGTETGSDSFQYMACDEGGLCSDAATVTIAIGSFSDHPSADSLRVEPGTYCESQDAPPVRFFFTFNDPDLGDMFSGATIEIYEDENFEECVLCEDEWSSIEVQGGGEPSGTEHE
jgi:hypothetical protein